MPSNYYHPKTKEFRKCKRALDVVTRLLYGLMDGFEKKDVTITQELGEWWARHKQFNKERKDDK